MRKGGMAQDVESSGKFCANIQNHSNHSQKTGAKAPVFFTEHD
jgi:hypothetical protein